ncbi:MAG: hypothetical protein ACLU2K_01165 [Clostridia bacterium]
MFETIVDIKEPYRTSSLKTTTQALTYKKNMFALLGKPGYEDQKAALEAKLGR